MDVLVARLPSQPVSARGDASQVLNRFFAQLLMILEQPFEYGLRQRLFEFEADKFLTVPNDSAILRFEPSDVEPHAAIVGHRRGALDPASVA